MKPGPRSFLSLHQTAAAAVLLLAACVGDGAEGGPQTSGGFEADTIEPERLIHVLPVEGAQNPARLVLADAVVAGLLDVGRPALLAEEANPAGASIVGRIGNIETHGNLLWVDVIWQLRAPYGTPVAQVSQQLAVDEKLWREGGAEVVNLVIDDAMPRITEIVETHVGPVEIARVPPPQPTPSPMPAAAAGPPKMMDSATGTGTAAAAEAATDVAANLDEKPSEKPGANAGTEAQEDQSLLEKLAPNMDAESRRPGDARPKKPASVTTIQWGRPAFLVNRVAGAPGNGNEALTAALRSALRARDITISTDPRQAGFVIDGRVRLTQPVNGRQLARITWTVNTITGEQVGRAVQENNVVAGTLDGEWGRVAEIVAGAAVKGVEELFGAAENRVAGEDALPSIPDIDLPQVPGRAPPPPKG